MATANSRVLFDPRGAKGAVILEMAAGRARRSDNKPLFPHGETDADLVEG